MPTLLNQAFRLALVYFAHIGMAQAHHAEYHVVDCRTAPGEQVAWWYLEL